MENTLEILRSGRSLFVSHISEFLLVEDGVDLYKLFNLMKAAYNISTYAGDRVRFLLVSRGWNYENISILLVDGYSFGCYNYIYIDSFVEYFKDKTCKQGTRTYTDLIREYTESIGLKTPYTLWNVEGLINNNIKTKEQTDFILGLYLANKISVVMINSKHIEFINYCIKIGYNSETVINIFKFGDHEHGTSPNIADISSDILFDSDFYLYMKKYEKMSIIDRYLADRNIMRFYDASANMVEALRTALEDVKTDEITTPHDLITTIMELPKSDRVIYTADNDCLHNKILPTKEELFSMLVNSEEVDLYKLVKLMHTTPVNQKKELYYMLEQKILNSDGMCHAENLYCFSTEKFVEFFSGKSCTLKSIGYVRLIYKYGEHIGLQMYLGSIHRTFENEINNTEQADFMLGLLYCYRDKYDIIRRPGVLNLINKIRQMGCDESIIAKALRLSKEQHDEICTEEFSTYYKKYQNLSPIERYINNKDMMDFLKKSSDLVIELYNTKPDVISRETIMNIVNMPGNYFCSD